MDEQIHQIEQCRQHAELILEKRAILDLHSECSIQLFDSLHLGYNLRNTSCMETCLKMHKNSMLRVNGCFKAFYGSSIEVFSDAVLTVGKSYINSECIISCAAKISIGNGVAIARRVMIYDSDHHRILDEYGNQKNPAMPIAICDHVWIGVGAIILKGVTLGQGCIVAAGAVVTHSVPAGCLVAGNPARVLKQNVEWS